MIIITLHLSESLLCILRDSDNPKPEKMELRAPPGTPLRDLLISQNISPLLVPMAAQKQPDGTNTKIPLTTPLDADAHIILYGPLAGG